MGDFFFDHMGKIITAVIVGLIWLLFVAFSACNDERKVLIQQCEQSGKAGYECKAMFVHYCSGGGGTYVAAPVVINSGRR